MMAGCTGDLIELNANKDQGTGGGPPDMAQAGGGEMGPSNAKFADIQMDLDTQGCTLTACHGAMGNGSVMYVKPMATAQADLDTNYTNVKAETNPTAFDQSNLLTKPVNPGITHSGTKPFASMSDPTYQKWLGWITAGAPR